MAIDDRAFDKLFFSSYIGSALSQLRKNKKITIVDIAASVGVKHPYVANILNGRAVGNTQVFAKIAAVLGMATADFEKLVQEAKMQEFQHTHGKNIGEVIGDDLALSLRNHGVLDEEVLEDILKYIDWRKSQQK